MPLTKQDIEKLTGLLEQCIEIATAVAETARNEGYGIVAAKAGALTTLTKNFIDDLTQA